MNLGTQEDRIKLIQSIKSENTKSRKQYAFKSSETQGGRFKQYVKEHLQSQFFTDSVREMPIIASINIQKAVVAKKATIYKRPPKRNWTGISDDQKQTLTRIYRHMQADKKLNTANQNYCYQDQTIGMIVPKNGKYVMRIFKMHQVDAIPDYDDPETARGYIISAFDRTDFLIPFSERPEVDTATGFRPRSLRSSSNREQKNEVADEWQFKKYTEKYIVWDYDYHFLCNGLGEVLDPETGEPSNEVDITNPLGGTLPFFEVAKDKDFEFFVRPSNILTDFTIEFNSALSDLQNTMKMNGYAVGVLKAPSELQPEGQVIGAAMLLKLPTDNPEAVVDFQFVSPNANIGEISSAIDRFLNYFTTSEGLGSEVINSGGDVRQFSSGLDRFISMINRIEAHQDDYEKFRDAENKIYEIIKAWNNVLMGSNQIGNEFKLGSIPDDSEVDIAFYQPEVIQTEAEKLDVIDKKLGLGLISQIEAIMHDRGITDIDEAKKLKEEIDGIRKEEGNVSEVLNGAQVTSLVNVVEKIATGVIPKETGEIVISTAFNVPQETARLMLDSVKEGSFDGETSRKNQNFSGRAETNDQSEESSRQEADD